MHIEMKIKALAEEHAEAFKKRVAKREREMKADDNSHFLIYKILGVSAEDGHKIDLYQNIGRFLYRRAGSFLEEAATLCFLEKYPDSKSAFFIPNSLGTQPKRFEIDCLVRERDAIEIKWRDATTDGDHTAKEKSRLKAIKRAGYLPIRVMFYYPNRSQAMRIQKRLEKLYEDEDGQYYYGDRAWRFIAEYTGVDLLAIIQKIAQDKVNS